jgi:hypothetical protein
VAYKSSCIALQYSRSVSFVSPCLLIYDRRSDGRYCPGCTTATKIHNTAVVLAGFSRYLIAVVPYLALGGCEEPKMATHIEQDSLDYSLRSCTVQLCDIQKETSKGQTV